jgi:hypothetical protein
MWRSLKQETSLQSLTDDFTHFHLVKMTMNTHTQYMSANITLPSQERFSAASQVHDWVVYRLGDHTIPSLWSVTTSFGCSLFATGIKKGESRGVKMSR